MITVAQLIEHLKTFDQGLPVAYQIHSEQCLMDLADIAVAHLSVARPDGWVADARPDQPTTPYLLFPGN